MYVCLKHYWLYLWFHFSWRNWIFKPYPLHNNLAALTKLYRKPFPNMRTDYCAWHLSQKRSITCHYFTLTTVGTFTIMKRRLCSLENGFACSFFQLLKLQTRTFIVMVAIQSSTWKMHILCDSTRESAHTPDWMRLTFLTVFYFTEPTTLSLNRKITSRWCRFTIPATAGNSVAPQTKPVAAVQGQTLIFQTEIPLHTCNWSFWL